MQGNTEYKSGVTITAIQAHSGGGVDILTAVEWPASYMVSKAQALVGPSTCTSMTTITH